MAKLMGFTHDSIENDIEWYTPAWIFNRLDLEFDLDVAAPPGGISWIPAKRYYSKENDGLVQPWEGRVWLNPPYGRQTGDWMAKMHWHRNGIALLFSRTDCAWFHDYVVNSNGILFLKKRVNFINSDGKIGEKGAGSGSMLSSWGDDNKEALRNMSDVGFFVDIEPNYTDIDRIKPLF